VGHRSSTKLNPTSHSGQRALDVQLEDTAQASGVLIDNTVSGAVDKGGM
jgi:hypothetical protein